MPYYRLSSEAIDQSEKAFEHNANSIQELFYDEQGLLIVHSKKQLDKIKGLEKVSKGEYDKLHSTLVEGIAQVAPSQILPEMGQLEQASNWLVEPYSSRQASITQAAVRPGVTVMNIQLGAGRGDTIYIGRTINFPEQAGLLRVNVQTNCSDNDNAAVGIVLTTERERPWLAFDPVTLHPGVLELLEFNLTELNDKKLSKINRINIVIVTAADEGYVLIQDMQICNIPQTEPG